MLTVHKPDTKSPGTETEMQKNLSRRGRKREGQTENKIGDKRGKRRERESWNERKQAWKKEETNNREGRGK